MTHGTRLWVESRPPYDRRDTGGVGALVKAWRQKRRLSQLALALEAGISSRHLSFVETGRARPSPDLLMSLAECLEVPLRGRNELLLAAGFAPEFPEHELSSPDLADAQRAIGRLLAAHDPYPGVALDRHWTVVLANESARRMMSLLPEHLTEPSTNMFRASLHPEGFAAITANFDEWGRYLIARLDHLAGSAFDAAAEALLEEVRAYPNVRALDWRAPRGSSTAQRLLVPCELSVGGTRLSLFTTHMTFGTPRDVTLSELTVELFYPSDASTATALQTMSSGA